jgi:hypothetical protein
VFAFVFAFVFALLLPLLGLETGELGNKEEGVGVGRRVVEAVDEVRAGEPIFSEVTPSTVRSPGGEVKMGGRKRCLREFGRGTLGKVCDLKVDKSRGDWGVGAGAGAD